MINWKGSVRERSCLIKVLSLKVWKKPRKTSFRIPGFPADIRTKDLPHARLQRYLKTNLFDP
jgi:hypothetical protein